MDHHPVADVVDAGTAERLPEGLHEPLSPWWRGRLRRAVVELARTPGRTHRPVLHVGEPGHDELCLAMDATEPSDPGLRTDLVAALLAAARSRGVADPLVWLTRSGELGDQDVDVAWLAATRAAGAEAGCPVPMVLVTQRGWRDPRSGLARTWVRLRLPRE